MKAKDRKESHFYEVIPACKEEIEYKLKRGMSALPEKYNAAGMERLLNVHRPNTCADFKEILN